MKVGPLLVGKEQVRFPDGVQHGGVEVQRVVWIFAVGQPRVVPLLSQEDVHSVVLQGDTEDMEVLEVWARRQKGLLSSIQQFLLNIFKHLAWSEALIILLHATIVSPGGIHNGPHYYHIHSLAVLYFLSCYPHVHCCILWRSKFFLNWTRQVGRKLLWQRKGFSGW